MLGVRAICGLALVLVFASVLRAGDEGEGDPRAGWRDLHDRAVALDSADDVEGAAAAYQRAAVWAEDRDLPGEAVLSWKGVLDCSPALTHVRLRDVLMRLLVAQRKTDDTSGLADTLMDVGYVHTLLGRPLDGIRALEEAGALVADDPVLDAHVRARLAYALSSAGDLGSAQSAGERAADVFRTSADAESLAETLGVLAEIHLKLGNPTRVLGLLAEGSALPGALSRELEAGYALYRGDAHLMAGRTERALESLREARGIFSGLQDARGAAWAAIRVGDATCEGELRRRALTHYASAWASADEYRGPRALAQLRMGDVCLSLGQTEEAEALYDLALAVGGDDLELRARAERGLADLRLAVGDAPGAATHARLALDALDGMVRGLAPLTSVSTRGGKARVFATARQVAFQQEQPKDVFELLERTRAATLLVGLGGRAALGGASRDVVLEGARERLLACLADLDDAVESGDLRASRAARVPHRKAQEDYRRELERKQREAPTSGLATSGRRIALADAQRLLGETDAFVLYAFDGDRLRAFVVRHDASLAVDVGASDAVLRTLEALRRAIVKDLDVADPLETEGEPLPAETLATRLRERLVEPLGLEADVKTLLVCPHGSLAAVPWGLVERARTVVLIPSVTAYAVLTGQARDEGQGRLVLGDAIPPVSSGLGRLPASRTEAEAVAGEGDVLLLEGDASESSFRRQVGERKRWRAVHFACHGRADRKRPAWSSLLLTTSGQDDGYLAVLELLAMQIPADVAVLSACETGLGTSVDGEGLLGLAGAFLHAGAPRVVASLWRVDDEATLALMVRFHELHGRQDGSRPLPAAEALRRAQEYVRTHPDHPARWKQPHYWAGWVLWGVAE